MQLHLPSRRTTPPARQEPVDGAVDARVLTVHRIGAVAVAAVILVFGILGFADGLAFFSTSGEPILGMSSNGLLSTVSVVTAAVLIAAAVRGARIASTVMIVVGALFILSALANLAVLRTDLNLLAFEFSNVVFSAVAGLTLLLVGAYGRLTGNLPATARTPATAPSRLPSRRSTRRPRPSSLRNAPCGRPRSRSSTTSPPPSSAAASPPWRRCGSRADRRRVWMEFDPASA